MAHAEGLADDVLKEVARQIGAMVSGVIGPDKLAEARLTMDKTPFEIWMLGADALLQPTVDLRLLASPTGRWHHQVALDEKVIAFARSMPLGAQPSSWRVQEFFVSELAGKIASAARWVDDENNVAGDPLVRLLDVPAYMVHAFWLLRDEGEGEEEVFVIDCPKSFTHLSTDRLLSQFEFIEALRREQHIIGRILS